MDGTGGGPTTQGAGPVPAQLSPRSPYLDLRECGLERSCSGTSLQPVAGTAPDPGAPAARWQEGRRSAMACILKVTNRIYGSDAWLASLLLLRGPDPRMTQTALTCWPVWPGLQGKLRPREDTSLRQRGRVVLGQDASMRPHS